MLLLGSLHSYCCLSARCALVQEDPCLQGHADRGAQSRLSATTGGDSAPEQPVFVEYLCGPLLSRPARGYSPSLQQCWSFPQQGKEGDLEVWLPISK